MYTQAPRDKKSTILLMAGFSVIWPFIGIPFMLPLVLAL